MPVVCPPDLSVPARAWYLAIRREHRGLEAGDLRLIEMLVRSWDCWQVAEHAIRTHGLVYIDEREAPRPNPAVRIARDSAATVVKLLHQLQRQGLFSIDPPGEDDGDDYERDDEPGPGPPDTKPEWSWRVRNRGH